LAGDMEKNTGGMIGQLAKLSIIGIEMVVSTFIGLAIGIYLDKKFETAPWLTIVFLIIGIIAGFRNIFREIRKLDH
jgi:ATP synthase protein I